MIELQSTYECLLHQRWRRIAVGISQKMNALGPGLMRNFQCDEKLLLPC